MVWRGGLGLGGGFGFGGPVGVHAELLRQVHVARFGHLTPPAADPGHTFAAPLFNTALHTHRDRHTDRQTEGERERERERKKEREENGGGVGENKRQNEIKE